MRDIEVPKPRNPKRRKYTYQEMEAIVVKTASYKKRAKEPGFDHVHYVEGFLEGVLAVKVAISKSEPLLLLDV
jgi:hypothetical protein